MSESFWTMFFATLPATLAALAALVVAIINAIRSHDMAKDIRKVEIATNSMKDKLVEVTGKEAFARGVKSEKDKTQ